MNVEELIVKANATKHSQNSKHKNSKSSKRANVGPRWSIHKKKFPRKYYNWDWVSHNTSKCKKLRKKREANLVDKDEGPDMDLYAMVSKVNIVSSNSR